MTTMDLSIRVAFSAIDKLTRPVSAASKAIGGLSDSQKNTVLHQRPGKSATSFDKLRSQANDTAQKLKSTQRAFDGLNQKQREGGQLTEAQTARLESLRTKLSRLTETYGRQTTQLRTAAQAVRQHGVNLTTGSGAIQSAIRRTEQYNQTLERERRQLAATQKAQARYDRAKETAGKLRGLVWG
jgi:chromosome segregation ATPase